MLATLRKPFRNACFRHQCNVRLLGRRKSFSTLHQFLAVEPFCTLASNDAWRNCGWPGESVRRLDGEIEDAHRLGPRRRERSPTQPWPRRSTRRPIPLGAQQERMTSAFLEAQVRPLTIDPTDRIGLGAGARHRPGKEPGRCFEYTCPSEGRSVPTNQTGFLVTQRRRRRPAKPAKPSRANAPGAGTQEAPTSFQVLPSASLPWRLT